MNKIRERIGYEDDTKDTLDFKGPKISASYYH
jgi:hypothetical protein